MTRITIETEGQEPKVLETRDDQYIVGVTEDINGKKLGVELNIHCDKQSLTRIVQGIIENHGEDILLLFLTIEKKLRRLIGDNKEESSGDKEPDTEGEMASALHRHLQELLRNIGK